ncbi:MAG: VanW family protein [Clostridiales bacterium]|nr:VanW family protein [Clostridiales bacterium]
MDPFEIENHQTPIVRESVEPTDTVEDSQVSVTNTKISYQLVSKDEILIKANYVIGEFKTNFSKSSESRKKNIRNAAKKINRSVLYPGEEFSISEHLLPFTVENGYYPAGTFVNGRVVNSLGGGVCQVSTTLYNAVLDAELTVTERHAHSKAVSYVEVGRDAAIAENQKDFRFVNSLDVPIVIEAVVTGYDTLILRIRCVKRYRDVNRQVTYETKILEEIEPEEPIITYDISKPNDYIRVIQSAYKGYKAEVYRIVTVNGEEVERVKISYNEYEASPQYMVVGKK